MWIIIFAAKDNDISLPWPVYLIIGLMLFIGIVTGIMAFPMFILEMLKLWYFYLFIVGVFAVNMFCSYLEWWKNWLIGMEAMNLFIIILTFIQSEKYYGNSGFIMSILMFITYYTVASLVGAVFSGIGSIISYKLLPIIISKIKSKNFKE